MTVPEEIGEKFEEVVKIALDELIKRVQEVMKTGKFGEFEMAMGTWTIEDVETGDFFDEDDNPDAFVKGGTLYPVCEIIDEWGYLLHPELTEERSFSLCTAYGAFSQMVWRI